MSSKFGDFDARNVKPLGDRSPVPEGIYDVVIMDAKWQTTRAGGEMFVLQFEILDGPAKGRYLWSRMNLVNKSEKAVEIARAELSSVCRAIGIDVPEDDSDFMNKQLRVSVFIDENDYNRIQNYAAPGEAIQAPRAPKPKKKAASEPDDPFGDDLPFS
jgi:hypothetical protein